MDKLKLVFTDTNEFTMVPFASNLISKYTDYNKRYSTKEMVYTYNKCGPAVGGYYCDKLNRFVGYFNSVKYDGLVHLCRGINKQTCFNDIKRYPSKLNDCTIVTSEQKYYVRSDMSKEVTKQVHHSDKINHMSQRTLIFHNSDRITKMIIPCHGNSFEYILVDSDDNLIIRYTHLLYYYHNKNKLKLYI